MKPMRVTIRLGSPVMLSYPWIALDSLIMHLALERDHAGLLEKLDPRKPVELPVEIPVGRLAVNGDYIYKASISRFSRAKTATTQIRKKVAAEDAAYLSTRRSKIDVVRGAFKAYDMRMVVMNARECEFHAVGDIKAVARLMENLDGLGKKRAVGYGRVLSVSVDELERDHSILHPEHGLNRPVPVHMARGVPGLGEVGGRDVALLAYRPPYWCKANHVLCLVPDGFGG